MTGPALALAVAIAGLALFVFLYLVPRFLSSRRNDRTGASGFVQGSRLTCPKCQRVFDYEWVPGAALTAVRLGKARYMACPLCHRWSVFNIWDASAPPAPRGP